MWALSVINIGFSIISALVLFVSYAFFIKAAPRNLKTIVPCIALLSSVTGLQLFHLSFLNSESDPLSSIVYRFILFAVPPLFYFFSRAVLQPAKPLGLKHVVHFLPVGVVFVLPRTIAVPLAFVIGTAYCFWLCGIVYRLRRHRKRYGVELFFYGFFALLAVFVLCMGFLTSYIDNSYFYYFYANGIAVAYMLVVGSFVVYPDLLVELEEVGALSYNNSTLGAVDVNSKKSALVELMENDNLYQNEDTNLALVAQALDISPHQLSELVNVEFGMGFSKFIRNQRVDAAKTKLLKDLDSSILAISMELGFKSQSNFYAAFKEITGMSPGQYRKAHSNS